MEIPRSIPGFFWDPTKRKYFKIQPDNIAPPDSAYSVRAINDLRLELQTERKEKRIKARRLKHDYHFYDPRTSLQYRLDNRGPGCTTSDVAAYYGASLSSRRVLQKGENSCPQFALDPKSGILFTGTCYNHTESPSTSLISLRQDSDDQGNWSWEHSSAIAQTTSRVASLMVTNGVLAWVEEPDTTGYVHLHIVSLNQDNQQITNHCRFSLPNEQKLQLTASPGGTHWLGWTSSTIFLRPALQAYLHNSPVVLTSYPHHKKEDRLLTVAFKDESVLMAGHRSGFVNFLDHRTGSESQVRRMRHDSPLNALRSLKDGRTILASGLTSTALYDTRYLAAPGTSKKSEPCSTPVLKFAAHTSDRLELGFDYLADLNMVAMASSSRRTHKVTLFSTRTGRRIPSALDREKFGGPVQCMKLHDTPDGRYRLLMTPANEAGPTLIEWGCDFDSGIQ